jgi:hypothetical protein
MCDDFAVMQGFLINQMTLRPIRRLCRRLCVLFFCFFPKEQLLAYSHFLSDLCIPNITSLTVQILGGGCGCGGGGGGGGGAGTCSTRAACSTR